MFCSVNSCANLLKYQAVKASCPLDLLAAESLGTRLVTIFSSTSDQLLTKKQLVQFNNIFNFNILQYIHVV